GSGSVSIAVEANLIFRRRLDEAFLDSVRETIEKAAVRQHDWLHRQLSIRSSSRDRSSRNETGWKEWRFLSCTFRHTFGIVDHVCVSFDYSWRISSHRFVRRISSKRSSIR